MMAFADAAQWESWLAENHDTEGCAWLKIARKGSAAELITIVQALEVALCYGWIDSQRKSHDAHCYLQRYSPRRAGSPWSRENVERVEMLTRTGRMQPSGLAEVAMAQADGRWAAAYAAQRNVAIPPDLAEILAANPRAAERFDALGKTARYLLILPVLKARTPASRARCAARAIASLMQDQ
jgi:uncharacterized protein YdeI (YjbR/CyaY-like superfamily)